jgi:hypothetical protein
MFKYPKFSVGITTLYLVVFALFAGSFSSSLAFFIFSLSPFLVIWMAFSVLKDKSEVVADLESEEHWGYSDRKDLRPRKG